MCSDDDMEKMVVTCKAVNPSGGDGGVILAGMRAVMSSDSAAPRPSKYVPDPMELEDHVPVYIPEPEHPEDLVPAEDEAPIEPYITEVAFAPTPPLPPPSLLPTLI
ncbi:hypothetical protein Tco_1153039 [Tanacetum coccineum]